MNDVWIDRAPTHDSPYWPFRKVGAADTSAGMEQIPYIIVKYLMDLPDGTGYEPPSDNKYPRARLKKLLYWDCPLPLDKPIPTTEQTKAMMFDPENPDRPPDEERGYRFFPQNMTQQAMAKSKSLVRVYLGDASGMLSRDAFITRQDVMFDVIVNVSIESNTGMTASSRAYDIVQAIREATAGVNFGGIGPLTFRRLTKIDDEKNFLGYKIYCYIDWCEGAPNPYFS